MVLKGIFGFGRKEAPQPEPTVTGNDGWVEIAGGKVVVHDPTDDGRYATITPEGCVRLFINDEEVKDPTAVTAQDRIRFEVNADPYNFFELSVTQDRMAAQLLLTADPTQLPDTVSAVGRCQVRLIPACSGKAKSRPVNPKALITERLRDLQVTFGVDDGAIERELTAPTYQQITIARGQEAMAPVAGEWTWKVDELSLVEAGQVIAAYQGGQANLPRIRVTGETEKVYEDIPQPQVYLAGNGSRLLPGGRMVASASGRARAVPTPQGHRVHIFPVKKIEGDLEADLDSQSDLIVEGSVKGAKISCSGEVLVMGDVDKAEIRADLITVKGAVTESTLCTMPVGHFAPLRAELNWLVGRLEAIRELARQQKPVPEETFREILGAVRAQRRKVEQMGIRHEEYSVAADELARVFMGAPTPIDLPTAAKILITVSKAAKTADQMAAAARDVRAGSLTHSTVWAGREITVTEKVAFSSLFSGGSIKTSETCMLSQSELVAGGEVTLGILATTRGSMPVNIRFGTRIAVEEAQMGATFEYLADRKTFERDQQRIMAIPNAKGQMIFRHIE